MRDCLDARGRPKWAQVAKGLPGRTPQEARCRWRRIRDAKTRLKRGEKSRNKCQKCGQTRRGHICPGVTAAVVATRLAAITAAHAARAAYKLAALREPQPQQPAAPPQPPPRLLRAWPPPPVEPARALGAPRLSPGFDEREEDKGEEGERDGGGSGTAGAYTAASKARPHSETTQRLPTSQYRGVSKRHGRWAARMKQNGTDTVIGRFDTELAAAQAYDKAQQKYEGRQATILNFPAGHLEGGEQGEDAGEAEGEETDGEESFQALLALFQVGRHGESASPHPTSTATAAALGSAEASAERANRRNVNRAAATATAPGVKQVTQVVDDPNMLPGWSAWLHTPASGISYKVYRGPAGERVGSQAAMRRVAGCEALELRGRPTNWSSSAAAKRILAKPADQFVPG